MRAAILAALLLLAGCECSLRRDVKVDRRCPQAHCESESKCKCPAAQCPEASNITAVDTGISAVFAPLTAGNIGQLRVDFCS
jgi:outer membrane lipopolysaccharide assembly protein LptE/RlpB